MYTIEKILTYIRPCRNITRYNNWDGLKLYLSYIIIPTHLKYSIIVIAELSNLISFNIILVIII